MREHDRIQLLIHQGRLELALREAFQVLAKDPNDGITHLLLAICYKNLGQLQKAMESVEQAIAILPEHPRCYLIQGCIYLGLGEFQLAQEATDEALRLDPSDIDNYSILSTIHFERKRWRFAIEVAELGLKLDPGHPGCLSIKALSLERLGRSPLAVETAYQMVANNPEHSRAHSTYAWALLCNGRFEESRDAFKESLRLDASNAFAQSGLVQALNTRHFLYRLVFRWFMRMRSLPSAVQWLIVLGLFHGNLVLLYASGGAIWALPICYLYAGFCLLTWLINPIFNTLLRFNAYERNLLTKSQLRQSRIVVLALLFVLVLGLGVTVIPGEATSAFFGCSVLVFLVPVSAKSSFRERGVIRTTCAIFLFTALFCLQVFIAFLFVQSIVTRWIASLNS